MEFNPTKLGFSFFPEQASTIAWQVDALYFFLTAVTVFFTLLVVGLLVIFAVRYRRRNAEYRPPRVETSKTLEIVWSVIPLILTVIMFYWGAEVFFDQRRIPADAMEISVTGKKWMWKFQHPNGRREINVLHVPIGQNVLLRMASEDVLHDVFIPAFRVKQDVLPGRYTTQWFNATKTGIYHLFCNQYCGAQHSNMIGSVVAMEPPAYQAWLSGFTGEAPEKAGENLFSKLACNTCHMAGSASRGPDLGNLIGSKVALQGGQVITADENYIRESVLNPQAKVVAGFQPIMPSFQGIVTEEQLTHLIAYIKTLKSSTTGAQPAVAGGLVPDPHSMQNAALSLTQSGIAPAPAAGAAAAKPAEQPARQSSPPATHDTATTSTASSTVPTTNTTPQGAK
ncbi:MAG: cytochrome c oxidase subunit II [Candidatus Sumerlaeaceae bacterium]